MNGRINILTQRKRYLKKILASFTVYSVMPDDAAQMMEKANKRASGVGRIFSWFIGSNEKLEDAAELYTNAANKYKMDKECIIPLLGSLLAS